jgi:hypothetical protein
LARDQRGIDPKEFYVHTMILATRLEKEWKYTFPFTVDSKEKAVLTFPAESFFSDMMKQGLELGEVALHQWPQPRSPPLSRGGEDSVTASDDEDWEDVEEVDLQSREQEEQPAEDDTGGQCAAPTPASDQTVAPPAGVPSSLPSTSAQQGANCNPAPRNPKSTSNHLREEDLVQGDLLAVPLENGSFKIGRLRRFATFGSGDTQVAVTLGEDASPFGFMRVSNYKVLDCLSVISDHGAIVGGNVVVHNLAEVKSPLSEKVHENRDWETFGIDDFKFCGHDFYFNHR